LLAPTVTAVAARAETARIIETRKRRIAALLAQLPRKGEKATVKRLSGLLSSET